ncbi:hypothetical protein BH20ACI4_BH20ACI4_29570 [soil metagenome]
MSLKEKLHEISKQSGGKIPDDVQDKMRRATAELKDSGQAEKALNVGDKLPAFSLPDTAGNIVNSADLLQKGNLVLTFFRGAW